MLTLLRSETPAPPRPRPPRPRCQTASKLREHRQARSRRASLPCTRKHCGPLFARCRGARGGAYGARASCAPRACVITRRRTPARTELSEKCPIKHLLYAACRCAAGPPVRGGRPGSRRSARGVGIRPTHLGRNTTDVTHLKLALESINAPLIRRRAAALSYAVRRGAGQLCTALRWARVANRRRGFCAISRRKRMCVSSGLVPPRSCTAVGRFARCVSRAKNARPRAFARRFAICCEQAYTRAAWTKRRHA